MPTTYTILYLCDGCNKEFSIEYTNSNITKPQEGLILQENEKAKQLLICPNCKTNKKVRNFQPKDYPHLKQIIEKLAKEKVEKK